MSALITKSVLACLFVTATALSAHGQATVFLDQSEFEAALMDSGAMLSGTVDFENNNASPDLLVGFPNMTALEFGVPLLDGDVGFPKGLSSPLVRMLATGMESNALLLVGQNAPIGTSNGGLIFAASPSLTPLDFLDALTIEIQDASTVAIGFELTASDPFGAGTDSYSLSAFDLDGAQVVNTDLFEFGANGFVGIFAGGNVLSSVTVDNLFPGALGGEVVGDMQLWMASSFILGDVNCDGSVDLLDVSPFVDLLISGEFSEKADINTDGAVDLLDVGPFVDLLAGG